jgi:acyl-CoA thioesterase FadM
MLSASLFPALFSVQIPGSIYVSQRLRFRKPIHSGELVIASIVPQRIRCRLLECETNISKEAGGETAVEGIATVLLPEGVHVESPTI